MGLITTMGRFSYIQCDARNCNRKIERSGEDQVKELASLCGWVVRNNQWFCPTCSQKELPPPKRKKTVKAKTKIRVSK